MIIAGVDLSLRGTAIFIEDLSTGSTKYYYFTENKKEAENSDVAIYVANAAQDPARNQELAMDRVIESLKKIMMLNNIDFVFLEAPIGMRYNWMDIYGIFKYYLRRRQRAYKEIYATSLKKYATGAGNADKCKMGYALRQEFDLDFDFIGENANNIVDAAWLCKLLKAVLEVEANPKLFEALQEHRKELIGELTGLKKRPKKPRKKKANK